MESVQTNNAVAALLKGGGVQQRETTEILDSKALRGLLGILGCLAPKRKLHRKG
jgi:hypothetical protein